jgi:neuropeptide Y receptor
MNRLLFIASFLTLVAANNATPDDTALLSTTSPVNDLFDNGKPDLDMLDSKLNEFEETCIIVVFLIVIILGFFGNILVVWTVVFNKHMRTTSNFFILNLAISDLTLCVFSIPFNAYKTLKHSWAFGLFLCKLAPFFQATNVFVSTMSITAIALDRYTISVFVIGHGKKRTKNEKK